MALRPSAWPRALCSAWELDEIMKEVVMGEPKLNAFHDADPGVKRFVDRHEAVARDPVARLEYFMCRYEEMFRALESRDMKDEGIAEGIAKGIAKGRAERDLEIALKAFKKAGRHGEDFSIMARRLRDLGISPAAVEAAREQVESERPPGGRRAPGPPTIPLIPFQEAFCNQEPQVSGLFDHPPGGGRRSAWELDEIMKKLFAGDPELKALHDADPGVKRFVDRHEAVPLDPVARQEYFKRRYEEMLRALELRDMKEAGRAEGRAEGIAEGRAKRDLEIALKAFKKAGRLGEDFSIMARRLRDLGISPAAVEAARKQVESKPSRGDGRR